MTAVPSAVIADAVVLSRMDFADGAHGAAGHEVTDSDVRELMRQVAAGVLTGDEAIRIFNGEPHVSYSHLD